MSYKAFIYMVLSRVQQMTVSSDIWWALFFSPIPARLRAVLFCGRVARSRGVLAVVEGFGGVCVPQPSDTSISDRACSAVISPMA